MARFRYLDPAMRDSPDLDGLSLLARHVVLLMMSEADDEGRLHADDVSIRAAAFPRGLPPGVTAPKLSAAISELETRAVPLIVRYEANGRTYAAIPGWKDADSWQYQWISHRADSR